MPQIKINEQLKNFHLNRKSAVSLSGPEVEWKDFNEGERGVD